MDVRERFTSMIGRFRRRVTSRGASHAGSITSESLTVDDSNSGWDGLSTSVISRKTSGTAVRIPSSPIEYGGYRDGLHGVANLASSDHTIGYEE